MANIFHTSGGKVIENKYFLASRDQCLGQMRSDETCPTGYEIAHDGTSLCTLSIWPVRVVGTRGKGRFLAYLFAVSIAVSVWIVAVRIVIIRSPGIDCVENDAKQAAFDRRE